MRMKRASEWTMNSLSDTMFLSGAEGMHANFGHYWLNIKFSWFLSCWHKFVYQDWQCVYLICVVGLAASFGAPFSSPHLMLTSFKTPRQMGNDRYSGPYSCPNCTKVYQHRPSLSQHLKHECGKEPQFQCPFCPQRTTQKGSLRKHIRRRHNLENH